MAIDTDLCNRALQMAMARSTITSLSDGSNEANQATLIYAPTLKWCLGVTNWSFARKTAVLTLLKSAPGSPTTWTTASPPPPWAFEYTYPSDCIRMRYVTNMAVVSNKWVGLPSRFQVSWDDALAAKTILSDQANAIAVYTMYLITVDNMDSLFQQAFVSQLAWMFAAALSGKEELVLKLIDVANQNMGLAVTANTNEGLVLDDTTPEWITARGMVMPERRLAATRQKQEPADGNRR